MDNLIVSLKEVIVEAGKIALNKQKKGLIIEYKQDNSPVTNADQEISNLIYDKLQILSPNVFVICEERDSKSASLNTDNFWLIDPIDGTKSYIKGEDTYTINIGLIKNGKPVLGFIYQPATMKLYYTDSKFCLRVEQGEKELAIPLASHEYKAVVSHHQLSKAAKSFFQNHAVSEITSIPSSIKLCLIAEGAADVYPRYGQTMEWDIAAGHALIRASGGDIFDDKGNSITYGKHKFENSNFLACSNRWIRRIL